MPSIRILVISAAAFLMLCVTVICQTPISELQKVDLVSVPLDKQLLVPQMRKSISYLNCNESRKFCTNNLEKLEFGLCSWQSWPGWTHAKSKDDIGNMSALFYEPIGPDEKFLITYEKPLPKGSPGQNGYPSNGGYPWPNGLPKSDWIPDFSPYGELESEQWYKFGQTHSDDRLVAQDKRLWQFTEPQDAYVTIQYPLNSYDVGTVVSYCLVSITTDSGLSSAHIIGGGIDHSYIEINLYVYSSRLFGWTGQVYAW